MKPEDKSKLGLNRREFIKTLGLGAAASASAAMLPGQVLAAGEPAKAAAIPKRKLGKSGIELPSLCLGGMFDTLNNQLLLKQALNWGVTYWDTAEVYGNGLSEEGFGRYFQRNPGSREQVFLTTKLVLKGGNFTERLDKCLQRLNTDHVDFFMIHSITGINEMDDSIKAWAAEMKKAGKFKLFGFSTHTNMEDCLLGAAKLDWIDAVMITYNFRVMSSPAMKAGMDACAKAGIGVVAMKTQAAGPAKNESEAGLAVVKRFMERGFTDKQANLKAVWENPQITSICSQMHNLTILSSNVAASRDMTALASSDYKLLREYAEQTKESYCAGCGGICLEATDGKLAVNEVMRCLMYYHDYAERDLAREVYACLPEEAKTLAASADFSRAEKACPQGLAIGELMREASRILA